MFFTYIAVPSPYMPTRSAGSEWCYNVVLLLLILVVQKKKRKKKIRKEKHARRKTV